MSVSQVAEHVGFFDSKYFCVFFKKHTGLTPTQYKRVCATSSEAREEKDEKPKEKQKKPRAKSKKSTSPAPLTW